MPNMDWKKETSTNTVYPAGTYYVRIISHERCKAKTGTNQIRWRAEIVSPEENRGRTMIDHTALTEAALWRTANMVASCGVDTSKSPTVDTDSPSFTAILDACKERKLYWRVEEEVGQNGLPRNSIAEYKQDPDQPVIEPTLKEDIAWDEEEKVK